MQLFGGGSVQRFEVAFGFANALVLMFSGLYAFKESLERVLQPKPHEERAGYDARLFFLLLCPCGRHRNRTVSKRSPDLSLETPI